MHSRARFLEKMMRSGKCWSHQLVKAIAILGMIMLSSAVMAEVKVHDYGDALTKSILFFEGQRSGKLPKTQRITWRKDSALQDGADMGVDLVGGYYDAGDNVKYNFPMAFSTTMLAWSVLEYHKGMGSDLQPAMDAIRWSTDYLLKSTNTPNLIFVQVGQAQADHNCWERPEDMDTPRTSFAVTDKNPGSEVSAEIAAALAAASLVFKKSDFAYSKLLLQRASQVFEFADKFRGSYNVSLGQWVCPWYCDYSGYQDELLWAATWLLKVTKKPLYWGYVKSNIVNFRHQIEYGIDEFGWDTKHAGISVLISKSVLGNRKNFIPYIPYADKFVCNVLPESPSKSVSYTPGGLLYKSDICNIQHTTSISFLMLTYAKYLKKHSRIVDCGNGVTATPTRLMQFAKTQVDYILGTNPKNMSYMVGYGGRFPQRIHHRGSSLPSLNQHQNFIACKKGTPYFQTQNPNPNLLIGAVVGGPDMNDKFYDDRVDAVHSEPTTYVNAPLVGLLAHFNKHSWFI